MSGTVLYKYPHHRRVLTPIATSRKPRYHQVKNVSTCTE